LNEGVFLVREAPTVSEEMNELSGRRRLDLDPEDAPFGDNFLQTQENSSAAAQVMLDAPCQARGTLLGNNELIVEKMAISYGKNEQNPVRFVSLSSTDNINTGQ
jgi:hypothetical protein